MLQIEQRSCRSLLDGIYGDNAVWLRPSGSPAAPACPLIGHMLDLAVDVDRIRLPVRALADALPVQTHSQRLVVVQHVTDLCSDPEALMREIGRVLLPDGILLLLALNPFSPSAWWQRWQWGKAGRWVESLRRPAGYWHARLGQCGIETMLVRHLGPLMPGRALLPSDDHALGANVLRPVYVLLARKSYVQSISLGSRLRFQTQQMPVNWAGGMSPGRVGHSRIDSNSRLTPGS